jgi:hypothetical protein
MLLSIEFTEGKRWDAHASTPQHAARLGREVRLGAQISGSRIVVDGKKTPEDIPDALAYKHLLSATSVRRNASFTDLHVQRLQLDRIGLSDQDRRAYLATVQSLRRQLEARASSVIEQQLIADAIQRLRDQLSPDGFQRLDDYVRNRVKPRITIFASER